MSEKNTTAFDAHEYYDMSRMYHRYHIPNLRRYEHNGVIEAVHQMPLAYPDDGRDQFSISPDEIPSMDPDILTRKVMEAAYYDYESLRSRLERGGLLPHTDVELFYARHEERGKRLIVQFANRDVANPKRVFRFRVYRWPHDDSDVYLVCTQQKIADAFLKRFAIGRPEWIVQYSKIDLQRMTSEGQGMVRSGTFADIKGRPNLSSTSLSGRHVDRDAAWIDLSKIGQLKTTIVQHKLKGEEIDMMVTNRGGIMIYGVEDIAAQLALVTQAYQQIVTKYEVLPLKTLTPTSNKVRVLR